MITHKKSRDPRPPDLSLLYFYYVIKDQEDQDITYYVQGDAALLMNYIPINICQAMEEKTHTARSLRSLSCAVLYESFRFAFSSCKAIICCLTSSGRSLPEMTARISLRRRQQPHSNRFLKKRRLTRSPSRAGASSPSARYPRLAS